jgi:hypothetical protein
MFARSVSVLVADRSALWMFLICVCTLVTELTSRKNRPLIPAPSASHSHWKTAAAEFGY